MAFPYQPNDSGQLLTQQAILGGVAGTVGTTPVLQVSTVNSITTTAISANQSLSAVLLTGTANIGFVSAMQSDATSLHVSAVASDAGLFRVSAIGGTAGDRTLVDGTTQTISATLTPVSASPVSTTAGLVTNDQSYDAGKFHASAFSPDGGLFRVSAVNFPLNVSGTVSTFVNQGTISAYSPDASLFRISAVNFPLNVSGTVSTFINQGTVSAYSPDAGLFHISGFTATATNFPVSATQADAGLLHASAYESVTTTNTGAASLYFTSTATNSQVSTVKGSAGRLYGYHFGNPAGVDQYVQIFNASAGAQAGTDAPTLSLYVPTLGGAVMSMGAGIGFSNGIQFITTSTAAGNTVGASGVRVNFFYA